jgi:DNA invertase Pin-like site-specific DNA recombinase
MSYESPRQTPSESSDHWRTILTAESWIKIRTLYDGGLSITMIAVRFGVERTLIWKGLKNHKGEKSAEQRQGHHNKDIDKPRK